MKHTGVKVSKFESRWREGIWLGHGLNNNEVLIGTEHGVVRAYTYRTGRYCLLTIQFKGRNDSIGNKLGPNVHVWKKVIRTSIFLK